MTDADAMGSSALNGRAVVDNNVDDTNCCCLDNDDEAAALDRAVRDCRRCCEQIDNILLIRFARRRGGQSIASSSSIREC
jgi:hypothetical protein